MPPSKIIDLPPDADLPRAEVLDTFAREASAHLGDIVENADGSATIQDIEPEASADTGFYDNLAETLDDFELNTLSSDLLEKIELDRESRKKRDEQYEEGLRRTGLGDDAPGGAQFNGASRVVHPLLAEACIDFSARTMKELFPPKGPVKSHILSKTDSQAVKRAELKTKVLNWQLTQQMREYREEMEQLTTQEPMGGSQYLKIWHDAAKGRHRAEFIPVDMLLLPYAASGLYSAERVTHVQNITQQTFEARVKAGLYRDVEIGLTDAFPDKTRSEKANEKIEGKAEDPYNEDGLRQVYEIYVYWTFKEDDAPLPYIIHIDDYTEEVLGVYRNWDEEDERCEKLDWIVEFKFIPWRGAYGIGLPHLIGGISGALTGALRALLDSAHINNAATMLKLKGIRGSGESTQVEVTQVCEIEAPPQVDDIRKVAMPMPFNPPSPVLFSLLGFLSDTGKGVVGTAEEAIADASNTTPVGTTLALIEQGSQVYSSIHTRHHFAQQRALEIICRLNRQYPECLEDASEALQEQIDPQLFDDNSDIEPISDPNIFSETQRYAQIQAVMQLLNTNPVLAPKVNQVALAKIAMQRMKFNQADEVLPDDPEPQQTDPVNENVFATKGLPLAAYMEQDHIAHLIVHLDFCDSPLFGANPLLTVPTVPALVSHCAEHFSMLYSQHMRAAVAAFTEIHGAGAMDEARMADGVKNAVALAQRELATQLAPIMPMLQNAQQLAMASAPKPPLDPSSQVALQLGQAEIQRKMQLDQATLRMNSAAAQAKAAAEQAKFQVEQQRAALEAQMAQQQQQFEQQMEQLRLQREHDAALIQAQAEIAKNEADNQQHQMTELLKNREDNNTQIIIEAMRQQLQDMSSQIREASAGNTAMNSSNDPDVMLKIQKILESSSQAAAQNQHHEATQAILQGLHGVLQHVTAPKQVVRDAQGNIVGVQTVQGG